LSTQDRELGERYKHLRRMSPLTSELVSDQQYWLQQRDSCHDKDCLLKAYTARNTALQGYFVHFDEPPAADLACPDKARPSAHPGCTLATTCAENADHSTLQAVDEVCKDGDEHYVTIYTFATRQSAPVRLATLYEGNARSVAWSDRDRNGYAELDVTVGCGAGPNCYHSLYRYDPSNKSLYSYYSGGYSDLSYLDGYLVESGRASCCSWEYHAYKILPVGTRDKVLDDKMIRISVSADTEDDNKPASCSFELVDDMKSDKSHPVKPPGKKWLDFCKLYSEKFILNGQVRSD
jgi:hypothetical protein